jgi:hypothetical protein
MDHMLCEPECLACKVCRGIVALLLGMLFGAGVYYTLIQ